MNETSRKALINSALLGLAWVEMTNRTDNLKQISFASATFEAKERLTRGEELPGAMNQMLPFAALDSLIEPHSPGSGRLSRQTMYTGLMGRMCLRQK